MEAEAKKTIPPHRTTLAALWLIYEQKVIPPNAPPVQRREMRGAFYGGAFSLLEIIFAIGRAGPTNAQGAAALSALLNECLEFVAELGKGDVANEHSQSN